MTKTGILYALLCVLWPGVMMAGVMSGANAGQGGAPSWVGALFMIVSVFYPIPLLAGWIVSLLYYRASKYQQAFTWSLLPLCVPVLFGVSMFLMFGVKWK